MVFLFPPLKPPSPQISVAKVLIMCSCHDKRLRNFPVSDTTVRHNFYRCSVFSSFFFKMAVFFLFLRNVLLQIEILKIKIPEHSDPPSQHFSVHKAFRHSFLCHGKVVLCHPAEWHNTSVTNKNFVESYFVIYCSEYASGVRNLYCQGDSLF